MMTQLEKIAEAIELTPGPDGDSLSQMIGENWRIDDDTQTAEDVRRAVREITLRAARAAIEATREPTPEQTKAAWSRYESGHIKTAWQIMVDVLLEEKL
jgi:hypothetical protein